MLLKTKWRMAGWIVCALIALLVVIACGKKQGTTTSTQTASETAARATEMATSNDPIRDYKVAYLTDEKMEKFIESMKEEMNPFDVVFKGGQTKSFSAMKNVIEKFNTFARKYGFKGYEDYTAVWGRITVGDMLIASQEMSKGFCVFRSNPASDSGPKWPLNPAESGHRFRSNPATFWPGPEYLKSEASLDNLTMFGHHGSSIEERRPRCQERGYPCARSKKC